MAKTRIIILDFDGTLADTTGVIIRTMQATIKELGLPSRTDQQCAGMIGLRLVEIPAVLFAGEDVDGDLYADTYRRLFRVYNTEGAVELYPNVIETLTELKNRGIVLTIASSRSNASLTDYVVSLGLTDIFSKVVGADDVKEGKPDPEPVNITLEKFGFKPEEAVVVGDTVFDIKMGINARTRTCGVTYGNGSRESLSESTWLIDDFAELLDKLNVS